MLHFPRFTPDDLAVLNGLNGLHASHAVMDVFEMVGPDGYPRKVIVKDKQGYGCYCPEGRPLASGKRYLSDII